MIGAILGVAATVFGKTYLYSWYFFLSVAVSITSFVSMCLDSDAIRKGSASCKADESRGGGVEEAKCAPLEFIMVAVPSLHSFFF